jgi:hypothetical protein
MYGDPEIYRNLAKQRQRDLIAEADRDRQAKAARDHSREPDTRRRDGR